MNFVSTREWTLHIQSSTGKPDPIDDNPFDKIAPPRDLLNVGWTEPGEWFNITVDVVNAESMLLIFFTQRRDPFVNKLFDIFSVAA
jgi:hypothetical protein